MVVTNVFVYTVNGITYDLRNVLTVSDWTGSPTKVAVTFSDTPGQANIFDRSSFEPAYQAALVAQRDSGGGGGGGGGVSDGDKGDITVADGGLTWLINYKGAPNGIATLDSVGRLPLAQAPAALSATLTYNLDGTLASVVTSAGTKTFSYNLDGTLHQVVGTGAYPTKTFSYTSGVLTGVTVS